MARVVDGVMAPTPTAEAEPFWTALACSQLRLPRCGSCKETFLPPMPRCPACGAADVGLVPASGRGRLYSWVVTHFPFHPAFKSELPFIVGLIELDEGARIYARLEGEIEKRPTAGARLQARIHDHGAFKFPVFSLCDSVSRRQTGRDACVDDT
ncbi:MAG: Zn-ribbon domain-containing OB-fold protein [Lautropia sp.]